MDYQIIVQELNFLEVKTRRTADDAESMFPGLDYDSVLHFSNALATHIMAAWPCGSPLERIRGPSNLNSPSYFSKCFQKQFGIMPKDF